MSNVLDRAFQYNSVIDVEAGWAAFSVACCLGVAAAVGLQRVVPFRREERCSLKLGYSCDIVLKIARLKGWIVEIACALRNKKLFRRQGRWTFRPDMDACAGPAHGFSLLQAHQRRTGQQA